MSVKSHRHSLHFTVALNQPTEIMLSLMITHFSLFHVDLHSLRIHYVAQLRSTAAFFLPSTQNNDLDYGSVMDTILHRIYVALRPFNMRRVVRLVFSPLYRYIKGHCTKDCALGHIWSSLPCSL